MSDSILSSNHRERARQIENIKRVARGDKVEKKIYVQMEDLDEKKKREEKIKDEREKSLSRSDALAGARTPWRNEASKPIEVHESVGVQELELETERWSQNTEQIEKMADEALQEFDKMEQETQEELESIEI